MEPCLIVENLYVRKGGYILVENVSLTVHAGELVVLLGPNGAGKTTLLRAIAGELPHAGKIIFNGHELYQAPEHWLPQIGLVPTENVLHETLTVRSALRFIGRLRGLPHDEIEGKVKELLGEFGLTHRGKAFIGTLSSGERKRANICAELLAEPRLFLLDEPTSGLDPGAERKLMNMLRRRAESKGQAILVVSHTITSLHFCHRVIFMGNARTHDLKPSIVKKMQYEDWVKGFESSKPSPEDMKRRRCRVPSDAVRINTKPDPACHKGSPPLAPWRQFLLLLSRYTKTLWNDGWRIPYIEWTFPLRLLVLTPLTGLLAGLLLRFVLQGESFIRTQQLDGMNYPISLDIGDVRQAVFLLTLVAALIGLNGSFREVANEIAIYRHERLKGLHPGAYLLSKFVILGLLYGVIAPYILLRILVTYQPFPTKGIFFSGIPEILVTLILTALATVGLGLAISAIGSKRERATFLMSIAVTAHALLSGLVTNRRWEDLIDFMSTGVTTRWAMEGLSTSVGIYCWAQPRFRDYHSLGHLAAVWLAVVAYLLATLAIATLPYATKILGSTPVAACVACSPSRTPSTCSSWLLLSSMAGTSILRPRSTLITEPIGTFICKIRSK